MKYLISLLFVVALSPLNSVADDWFCKTQSSIRRGDSFYSCGVAVGVDENAARAGALDNAQAEFTGLCRASDDCVGQSIRVHPARTDCEHSGSEVKCYREVVYTIESASQDSSAKTPLVAKGISQAALIARLGQPRQVIDHDDGSTVLAYHGSMCVWNFQACMVTIKDHRVTQITDLKPELTSYRK